MASSADISGLYAITDEELLPAGQLLNAVHRALQGGARVVQYRDKTKDSRKRLAQAEGLQHLCAGFGRPLIINDDVALAVRVGAAGVHIGREDGAVAAARTALGAGRLIGVSCYNDLDLARAAVTQGADYVAFGRVYPSATKPGDIYAPLHLIRAAAAELSCPVVAIGGITANNAGPVIAAGATAVAVIGDLFSSGDVAAAARAIANLFPDRPETAIGSAISLDH